MFKFDSEDFAGMLQLMDEHGSEDGLYTGENEFGETMLIYIYPDRIETRTMQKNNWTRVNVYYRDGSAEELYERSC